MTQFRKILIAALRRMLGSPQNAGKQSLQLRAWMMRSIPGLLSCLEFDQFVHDYNEGTLNPAQRRTFEFHLDLCPMCRVYLAKYLETVELGARISAQEASEPVDTLPEELIVAILNARNIH